MAIITGRCYVRSKDRLLDVGPVYPDQFNITLGSKSEYGIALDQSSTCTGIAIQDLEKNITMILDVKRDSNSKEAFYRDLQRFLRRIVSQSNIRFFVCEHPYNTRNQRYASTVLLELLGRVESWIEEWKYDFPSFQSAKFDKIYPQTWKSIVVNKDKGKNRSNNKAAIAADLCDLYPAFTEYYKWHVSKDYDAFDALGILEGYRTLAYSPEGAPQIFSIKEKRHTSLVGYRYVDRSSLAGVQSTVDFLGEAITVYNPVFKQFNPYKDKYDNVRMASSSEKFTVTLLPNRFLTELQWKFDFEASDEKVMVMYVLNKSKFTKNELSVFKDLVPWNEEVTGDV